MGDCICPNGSKDVGGGILLAHDEDDNLGEFSTEEDFAELLCEKVAVVLAWEVIHLSATPALFSFGGV